MAAVVITGDTSGSVTLQAPAVAGTTTLTLPSTSGTVLTTASTTGISGSAISSGTVAEAYGGTGTSTGYYGFKNRIINGAMVLNQRGASSYTISSAANTFSVDRFAGYGQATDGVYTLAPSSTAPTGFNNSLLATVTTADSSIGASQIYMLRHFIEGYNVADLGWGAVGAATVTLSFWVRCSLTGTFGGTLTNDAQSRFYPFSYTINAANTWEQKTITIAGDTTGTWDKTVNRGIDLSFSFGAGSSVVGTAGSWGASAYWGVTGQTNLIGTNGATFYITGVQLEKGSTATSFDYRPYGTELMLCQRYYRIIGQGAISVARALTQVVHGSSYQDMRAAPTATLLTTSPVFYNFATGANTTGSGSTINDSSLGVAAAQVNLTGFSGLTAGQAMSAVTTAITSLSAEL